jgi:DUF917 family protein
MPHGKLENLQDCEDFVRGCQFMGTGGGGTQKWGMGLLIEALNDHIPLEWVDVNNIPDDALTVTAYGMGSIAPITQETLEEIKRAGLIDLYGDRSIEEAVKELGNYLGKPVGCLVPAELGAGNTPAGLLVGSRLGIPVVDGDYSGRAVPEEMQGTPYLYGKKSWPFASVDRWGNIVLAKYTVNPYMLERIGKMLAVASFGHTTMAATPLPGSEMKQIVVRNTLTKCLNLGRQMRQAREQGKDITNTILEVTGGWRLFEGMVISKDWEDRGGYMIGTTTVEGRGDYAGKTLKVWFKNENHVSWLNGKPFVCSPDLLTLAHLETGEGITNTLLKEGEVVIAVGMKGLEAFRTPFGLDQASGPRYFGFDIEYVPIEVLMKDIL